MPETTRGAGLRPALRGMSHADGEAALSPNGQGAGGGEPAPFQAFRPADSQPVPAIEAHDPNRPFRPQQAASGQRADWGGGPFRPIAPPRQYDGTQPFRPIAADESQAQSGPHMALGQGRMQTNPTTQSDDLRGVLEARRTAAQAELTQLDADRTNPGRRREQLQADVHQLDEDIARLRSGGEAHGRPEETSAIAARHGVDPGQLRNGAAARGRVTVVAENPTTAGIGRARRVEEHEDIPEGPDGQGAGGGARTTTRGTSTALTENGLVRGTTYNRTTEFPDGATHTANYNRQNTIGIVNGGVGFQQQTTAGESTREANRTGDSRQVEGTRHAVITANGLQAGQQVRQTATVTAADGTSQERRDTRGTTAGATFNQRGELSGINIARTRETRREDRDGPRPGEETGATNRRQTSSSTVTGGLVRDDVTGTGVTIGGTRSSANADRQNARSSDVTGSATVTNRQVGANGTANGARNVGPVRVGGTFGAGGFYRIVAEPVPDTNPPMFDLVTTLQYEVTVGGSLGNNSDRVATPAAEGSLSRTGAVSVGAERRVRRTNTFRHRMTQAELDAYRVTTERAAASTSAPGGAPPEVALMTRLNAAAHQRRTPSDGELAGDPRIAASLGEGSSIENTQETRDTGRASARGTVGVVGGGLSVTRTHTGTVTRRSEERRVGGAMMVQVTLTFRDERETATSANAQVDGIGGALTHTQNDQAGRSVVVLLDPSSSTYAAQYREAYGVQTMAEAEALAQRTRSQVTRSEQHTTTNAGGVGTMENGAVSTGINQSERRQTSSEVTIGAGGRGGANGQRTLSGTTRGESESQLGTSVRGTRVLADDENTQATNTIGADGAQHVNVTNTQTGGVQTPALLQRLWRTTYQRMQSYEVDEGDLQALVGRAGNAAAWLNSLSGRELLHIQGPWMALRARLVSPNPPEEWRAADPTMAMKLARGQALTDFIGSVGPTHGLAAMHAILRDADPTRPLGVHWEWPDALRNEQRSWTTLHAEVRGAADRFAGLPAADRGTRIPTEVARITNGLRAIERAIEACTTFEDASAKVEMLDAIDRDVRQLERAGREANRPAGATMTTPQAAGAGAHQDEPETPEHREADARAQQEEQLSATRTTLERYKRSETGHWQSAQSHTQSARGRWLTSSAGDVRAAVDELVAIETDWVGAWGAAWQRAHELARGLGRPNEVPQNLHTNTNWRISLLREAVAQAPEDTRGYYDVDGRIARWRSEDER